MDPEEKELAEKMQERFAELPKVIQNAINSADIENRLKELLPKHHLHLDQWVGLENEVMLALYGFQPVEDLQKNIEKEVSVSAETAAALAADISRIVFEPIRQELERELEHPEAQKKGESDVETARAQILSNQPAADLASSVEFRASTQENASTAPLQDTSGSSQLAARSSTVVPATPPPAKPVEKAVRGPSSGAYGAGASSTERKDIHDDPYRESPA